MALYPRPVPTPPQPVSKTLVSNLGASTLPSGYTSLILNAAGGASATGNSGATNILVSNSNGQALQKPSPVNVNTLKAGSSAATTMIGGSGNDSLYSVGSSNPVVMRGGSGSSTMVAGSGTATLAGGSTFNLLVAGTGDQSLWGGNNYPTATDSANRTVPTGNTLLGGSGKVTIQSGSGNNTLISGSSGSAPTLTAATAKGSNTLRVSSVTGLAVGQSVTGDGIPSGTIISKVSGTTVTISTKTTKALSINSQILASSHNTLIAAGSSNILYAASSLASSLGNAVASSVGNSTLTGHSSLVAYRGNPYGSDLLSGGFSNAATLLGGLGADTLVASSLNGAAGWLESGASVSGIGNSLYGAMGSSSSVTLVPSSAADTISAGQGTNVFVVNGKNASAFGSAKYSLTNPQTKGAVVSGTEIIAIAPSISDTVNSSKSFQFNDSMLGGISSAYSDYQSAHYGSALPFYLVNNLTTPVGMRLGSLAGSLGISSIKSGATNGTKGDTIDVSNLSGSPFGITINASLSNGAVSITGSTVNDTIYLSKNGGDAIRAGDGNDSLVAQSTNLGLIDGGVNSDSDTLFIGKDSSTLNNTSFLAVQGIEVLSLLSGKNLIGSLQGSGINDVIGGIGSDILVANSVASLTAATAVGSFTLTLSLPKGTPLGNTLGFKSGLFVSGYGIKPGTRISANPILTQNQDGSGTMTVAIDQSLSVGVQANRPITAWADNTTLDSSKNSGFNITNQNSTLSAFTNIKNIAVSLNATATLGQAGEDSLAAAIFRDKLLNDPTTFIQLSGSSLTALGENNLLIAPNDVTPGSNQLPQLSYSYTFTDLLYKKTHKTGSPIPPGGSATSVTVPVRYVVNSTLNSSTASVDSVSGETLSNTLVGNSGHTIYLLNNTPGTKTAPKEAFLPAISLHGASGYITSAQAGTDGEIVLSGDHVLLNLDSLAFASDRITPGAVDKITTANGNNLITINASLGGKTSFIPTITLKGGNGEDTLWATTLTDSEGNPVSDQDGNPVKLPTALYIDGRLGTGSQSLGGGQGNDTILAGSGNVTIDGGLGNNSLIGGSGTSYITSGKDSSTLDGGNGASTLVATGGNTTMVIRNRRARILIDSLSTSTPELTVNSYVNFDPIQSTEVNQYAPTYPDGSPSITKSTSFASSDLASFYTIKNFNLLADFTTGIGAVYGVGNALDNALVQGRDASILNPNEPDVVNPSGALMLGMGGNNTLTSWGNNASLYGFSNESYASPDLYAAAPTDTRDQAFITKVMGTPGNNLLVAYGTGSFLDGGPGYNGGLGATSANTLVGNASNDTFVIRHRSDSVVAAAGVNTVYSTVDLNALPENITEAVLVVADQNQYLRNFSGNAPVLPSNSGQDAPATYLSYGSAHANSSVTHSVIEGQVIFSVPNSSQMQVQYGTYALNHFQSDSVPTPDTQTRDQYFPLTVSDPLQDGNNPGMLAYQLDWNADLMRSTGVVAGYTVLYRVQDDGTGQPGAWKTYVDGTSQDLQGTTENPVLLVDNLDSGFTYDFQVTAVQLEHPFTFDADGNEVATPVTLRGNSGNDVIWTFTGTQDSLGHGQNLGASTWYRNVNPILGNNPADPLPAGTIPLSGPYAVSHYDSPLFPVFLDGADGNNLLLSNEIGNGDGTSITIEAGTASNPQTLTYSGFNTMEGGNGSDTFVVANGTQNNFDLCIKYGNETPVDYTNTAPGVPSSLSGAGVSLNGGQHNLIASSISRIQLSDTTVSQGMFVDELLLLGGSQFGEGNRLDNFIYDVDQNRLYNTLVGNTGRDSILAQQKGDLLIGGTAALGDSIAGAMAGLYGAVASVVGGVAGYYTADTLGKYTVPVTSSTPTLQGSATVFSAYRDSDPMPAGVQGGPGSADPSQYWFVPGSGNYDPLRNSDTLIAIPGRVGDSLTAFTLDGGAGADSLLGSTAGDYFVVSTGGLYGENYTGTAYNSFYTYISDRDNTTGTIKSGYGDVVVGNGGNDTICFTGSDLWWSGNPSTYNTALAYVLSSDGDAQGGQSVSNVVLQTGAVNAIGAFGNGASTGNQHKGNIGSAELGSNKLIGNQFANYLDGAGVGGSGGQGYGADTLTGGGGSDIFVVGDNYRSSSQDVAATYTTAQSGAPVVNTYTTDQSKAATDADYVTITDFATTGSTDILSLNGTIAGYAIGAAPSSFAQHNIPQGRTVDTKHFGIYYINGTNLPNLVADITTDTAITLGSYLKVANLEVSGSAQSSLGFTKFNDQSANTDQANAGLNYLGFGAMYDLSDTSFKNFLSFP